MNVSRKQFLKILEITYFITYYLLFKANSDN